MSKGLNNYRKLSWDRNSVNQNVVIFQEIVLKKYQSLSSDLVLSDKLFRGWYSYEKLSMVLL